MRRFYGAYLFRKSAFFKILIDIKLKIRHLKNFKKSANKFIKNKKFNIIKKNK